MPVEAITASCRKGGLGPPSRVATAAGNLVASSSVEAGTSSGRRRELVKAEGRERLERRAKEGKGPASALVGAAAAFCGRLWP